MSISAITSSSTTSTSSVNSEMKQRRDTFSALEKAISSGDLDSAKTAFATMKSDMEKMQAIRQQITGNTSSSNSSSSSSSDDPMSKAMEALSTALESGDTSSVQDAFSSLKETMKAGRKRHAGHAEGDMPPPPPPSSSSTSSTSTTSNNNSDTLGSNIDVMA